MVPWDSAGDLHEDLNANLKRFLWHSLAKNGQNTLFIVQKRQKLVILRDFGPIG